MWYNTNGDSMKILIVPDSFKGSMTSKEVCDIIEKSLIEENAETMAIPFSDGGEGFSDCFCELCGGKRLTAECHDIYGAKIERDITVFGNTAVIETAAASGLQKRKQVMNASSYGTGELIKFACDKGYNHIILGLGGSGCCDGGAGAIEALGGRFLDENQNEIKNIKARDLNYIFGADFRKMIKGVHITFACDVDNVLYGKDGAAYVFAPQKGARKTDVEELDAGLQRLNAFFKQDVSKIKGGGAAGGICAGLYAIYGGEIKSGFDILSEYSKAEEKIKECDIIVTGEGKTDKQTMMGKLPYRIAQLAKKYNKKCVVICGTADNVTLGDKMITLTGDSIDETYAMEHCKELLYKKAKEVLNN